ncbi:hypothetical protein AC1031_011257 [Aphanomyces cochlioides]|nr:hypothetical protein AC1031_011257 [Aphanomyces cochlioides]
MYCVTVTYFQLHFVTVFPMEVPIVQTPPPPPRYTPTEIASLYRDVSKHLESLQAHSSSKAATSGIGALRKVTLPSDDEIATLVAERMTFLPQKHPITVVVNQDTSRRGKREVDVLGVGKNGDKHRKRNSYILVAGKQRSIPPEDLSNFKAFLRKHSMELANVKLTRTTPESDRKQRRQALIASHEEAHRTKVVGKQALIAELMRSTKFTMHDIFHMSCHFKQLAGDAGTISSDGFATIVGSHLDKFLSSHGMSVSAATAIEGTILTSQALASRLYGIFDQDGNGQIDFREFILGLHSLVQGTLDEKLDILFRHFDVDGNNAISIAELVRILNGGHEMMAQLALYLDHFFGHVDTNHDGITESEFVAAAASEPLVLEALSKPLHRQTHFQLRQSLRRMTERLRLDWSILVDLLDDVNEATKEDRIIPVDYEEGPMIPLTSAQFHNLMFQYLRDPQADDGHALQDLFRAYLCPNDSLHRGKTNCRELIRDLAAMLRSVDVSSDEARARLYFRFFDYDNDHEITRDQLSTVVCSSFGIVGKELLETMRLLESIDSNGDGQLTKEEYMEAAKTHPLLLASIYICI